MHDAADVLRELADLFTKKNQGYGPTYHSQGKFMQALFPNGIELKLMMNLKDLRFLI